MAVYYTQVTRVYDSALVELAQSRKLAPNNLEVQSTSLNHAAYLERILGRWDSALVHFQEAHSTEPHRVTPLENLALVQLWLRRYPEARNAADLALAIAPENLNMIQKKAMIALAEGDLPGARAVLATTPKEVDSAEVVVWMARYLELMWVLDDAQQRMLLRLRPEAFDDDIGDWGLALAQTFWLRGEQTKARTYADSARIAFEEYLRDEPEEAYYHAVHGLALAYLSRKTEAVQAGRRAVALMPISTNAEDGPYFQHQLARIYILIGEQELALDQLESLLRIPYYLSPSWLKIDPNFSSLRTNPRFQRLVAGSL
jgi:tetratricopeptide (TPR) repeat protein